MALKDQKLGAWQTWPRKLVRCERGAMAEARHVLADKVDRHRFGQFIFFRQLERLRKYAKDRGVRLIGDLPIFVSPDSATVWTRPELFQLDRQRRPKAVAGVPPDFFSETGQRWGNPLYDWDAMQRDGFSWWIDRVRATLAQVDLVRIDHFRGFAGYWRIPASSPTAETGQWVAAPGVELFKALRKALGRLPFIAEDLGVITPDVEALRDRFGLPGMRVLQFGFDGGAENPFLPHNYVPPSVAYTGTHDNDTTVGWFRSLDRRTRRAVDRYAPGARSDPAWAMMRLAWASVSKLAIAPAQDVLRLDARARMNVPGLALGNWSWRMREGAFDNELIHQLAELTQTYGRATPARQQG
jgi:4-alpha-glucanotransferase